MVRTQTPSQSHQTKEMLSYHDDNPYLNFSKEAIEDPDTVSTRDYLCTICKMDIKKGQGHRHEYLKQFKHQGKNPYAK